jgi:hypothetical protein
MARAAAKAVSLEERVFMCVSLSKWLSSFDGAILSEASKVLTRYSANDPQIPVNDRSLITRMPQTISDGRGPKGLLMENSDADIGRTGGLGSREGRRPRSGEGECASCRGRSRQADPITSPRSVSQRKRRDWNYSHTTVRCAESPFAPVSVTLRTVRFGPRYVSTDRLAVPVGVV